MSSDNSTILSSPRSNFVQDQTPPMETTATTTLSTITTTLTKALGEVAAEGTTTTAKSSGGGGLGGGAIAGIVIGILVLLALLAIGVFVAMRYMKDRRKNHGEYRPQWEEEHHAKDLPHLTPPNIEGLI